MVFPSKGRPYSSCGCAPGLQGGESKNVYRSLLRSRINVVGCEGSKPLAAAAGDLCGGMREARKKGHRCVVLHLGKRHSGTESPGQESSPLDDLSCTGTRMSNVVRDDPSPGVRIELASYAPSTADTGPKSLTSRSMRFTQQYDIDHGLVLTMVTKLIPRFGKISALWTHRNTG
ncbi:hypothetical protein BDM02DRAFT_846125 [Thelephora ganbajun]|uniref:Uncharacterized protein n=1 Tax=Thelephora ganbajun TaxID=370292 RepID=A0ACB6Z6L9_THEGA|nr:hypothetical protein BDM02DRAFT_846125 [Thelephora ganbajun]